VGHEQFSSRLVSERYRDSRIAVFSTGNVYGLSPVSKGGSREEDTLIPGEYAMTAWAASVSLNTSAVRTIRKMSILRLNYATELRYGVLLDVAQRVNAEQAVRSRWLLERHLAARRFGHELAISRVASMPPNIINVAGPELLSVRQLHRIWHTAEETRSL